MKLKLQRFEFGGDYTVGKLFIDGIFTCYTIEDEIRKVKVHGETAIPAGTYNIAKRYSPKFSKRLGHEVLWIQDVPNFQYILIHTGNTDDDTEGCLIVGEKLGMLGGQRAVLNSKGAYQKLYKKVNTALESGEKVTIEII